MENLLKASLCLLIISVSLLIMALAFSAVETSLDDSYKDRLKESSNRNNYDYLLPPSDELFPTPTECPDGAIFCGGK